ncbi:MAG TPA: protocatechuate 3,4-dioxygenase subunit beta [Gaiellales bacterium]|nr:protocatechuate 3,4-dioxygenase subunit beta [Gaiellales bacterium]
MSGEPFRRVSDGERAAAAGEPLYLESGYRSTVLRAPLRPLILLPERLAERGGPVYGHGPVEAVDSDLTRQHPGGEPLGERIVVGGRVTDRDGRPLRDTLIEVWQANAAGRYLHHNDNHPAPLDPNFTGAGRCLTDGDGRYRFVTVRPGAYPWRNHPNAWRPAHIHFSLLGRELSTRLVTQMYFPGDPLHDADPIMQAVRDPRARASMISSFDWEATMPEWALGFRFDIVLGGARATPTEDE